MLKYFAKVFLISLLSGSLLFMDIGSKGIQLQSALAAQKNSESHDRSMTTSVKTHAIDDSNLMATLTMTAIGLITSRLWSCKLTTDMMIAAAGGAVFIGGEVLEFFKLKESIKDMETKITRDKNGNINREQIASLERLKKSYEEAKKTAETKKMLQMAAAAAFAAAAVMAYSLHGAELAAMAACSTTVAGTSAICPVLELQIAKTITSLQALQAGRLIPSPSAVAMTKSLALEGVADAELLACGATAETVAVTVTSCATISSLITAACAPITPTLVGTSGFCPAAPGIVHRSPPTTKYIAQKINATQKYIFNLIISALFPEAKADLFGPLGIAGIGVSFLLATSKTLGPLIDTYLLAPLNRAIIWGILGGLTFAASSATDEVISQIDSNIAKIDMILNSINSMAKGATQDRPMLTNQKSSSAPKANNILKMNTAVYEDIDLSKAGGGPLPCFTGQDPKNCQGFDTAASGLPGNNLLDKNSQTQMTALIKMANGFNGTSKITKGALESAGNLALHAIGLRASADKAKKLAQERLKASGSKIDLDAESKKFSAQMEKAVRDGLRKSNSNASSMAASMYGGGGAGALNATVANSNAANENEDKGAVSKIAVVTPGTIDMSASGSGMAVDLGGAALETNKESTPEELAAYNAATKGVTSIDEFEIKNDITKDTSSSLFELISNRYQKSGYQRLFKLKEAAEVPVSK